MALTYNFWGRYEDYPNLETILGTFSQYNTCVIYMLPSLNDTITISGNYGAVFSDKPTTVSTATSYTWDKTKDIATRDGFGVRWVLQIYNSASSTITIPTEAIAVVTKNMNYSNSTFSSHKYLKYIKINGGTCSNTASSGLFLNCYSLEAIPSFSLSNITDGSRMFLNCFTLFEVDSSFAFSSLTNINQMFTGCRKLRSFTGVFTNATAMNNTFDGCMALKVCNLSNLSKVTSMQQTFRYCSCLQTIDLTSATNVTNFTGCFTDCDTMEELNIDLDNVSNSNIFSGGVNVLNSILRKLNITGQVKGGFDISGTSYLSHTTLLNIISKLSTSSTGKLVLGTNRNKLSSSELSQITAKGWTY